MVRIDNFLKYKILSKLLNFVITKFENCWHFKVNIFTEKMLTFSFRHIQQREETFALAGSAYLNFNVVSLIAFYTLIEVYQVFCHVFKL